MVTLGLLGAVVAISLGAGFILLARLWTLEVAFVRVSWIPLAAILAQGLFFQALTRSLSYAAVAIPVLTCFVSLLLTVVGAILVASHREREEPHGRILKATILASVPGVLFVLYILYAFFSALFPG